MKEEEIEKLKHVSNDDIKRGRFYWAAIPYTEERPLFVFKPIENAKFIGKKQEETAETFNGAFSDKTNRNKSEVLDIIVRHKRRLVLVVQNQNYNENENYKFVYVIPVTTHGHNSTKIKYVKENNNIPHFHYIGKATGEEAIANIGDIKRIHKSLLLENTEYETLGNPTLNEICKKIGVLMEINELEKCKECIHNHETYIESSTQTKTDENKKDA